MMMDAKEIFLEYICPSMGCLMSAAMYAAPVNELRNALIIGKLGALNPIPWAVMTGNAIAWCAYAYYSWDPFILASNIPGLIVSIWLNIGAAKLQYLQRRQEIIMMEQQQQQPEASAVVVATIDSNSSMEEEENDGSSSSTIQSSNKPPDDESIIIVLQETILLRILILWSTLLVCVGWLDITNGHEKFVIGILANINVIFFYGSPLQTMKQVIVDKSSESILIPTMIMNVVNTFFWILYGLFAKNDPVIYMPNMIGFILGLIQALLCLLYPSNTRRIRGEDNNYNSMEDPLLLQDFQDEITEFSPPISDELL